MSAASLDRRSFLKGMAGILAAGVAPAAIGSNILMPVRQIAIPAILVPTFKAEVTKVTMNDDGSVTYSWSFKSEWVSKEESDAMVASSQWKHENDGISWVDQWHLVRP